MLNHSCVILVCSVQLPAAASDNQVITFDEYYSTLQNEYSKYNILYEIDEYDDTFIFTRDIMDEQIAIAKEFAEGFRIEAEMEKPKLDKCRSNYTAAISPRTVMPVNFFWSGTVSILSDSIAAPGGIDLYATCSGQLNLGHNSIMAKSTSLRETYGINVGANNATISASTSGSIITVTISGSIKFTWNAPGGITSSATKYGPFKTWSFDANNYIVK